MEGITKVGTMPIRLMHRQFMLLSSVTFFHAGFFFSCRKYCEWQIYHILFHAGQIVR